jgi:hypothetical protein
MGVEFQYCWRQIYILALSPPIGLMARNGRRTTFLAELFNYYVSVACPLNVKTLAFFHPGNELKADARNSHLVETEEFSYPQDKLAPWHEDCYWTNGTRASAQLFRPLGFALKP